MAAPHRRGERVPLGVPRREDGADPDEDIGGGTWKRKAMSRPSTASRCCSSAARTDRAPAWRPRRALLRRRGAQAGDPQPAFHGNMALLPLPAANRMLVCEDVMETASFMSLVDRFGAERVALVSEGEIRSYATNGLPIGPTLLAPHLIPSRVAALVTSAGMTVEILSLRELCEKAGGASRCLVSHARLPDGLVHLPEENRLSAIRARIEAEDGPLG
ncbi:MAG: hypothetical protein R3B70_47375 [Polyangiaceae bacterium]